MREILRQNCLDLLNESTLLREIVRDFVVVDELQIFHQWVLDQCDRFQIAAEQNLEDLDLGEDDILPDILSGTQTLFLQFQLFNRRIVGHLLRSKPSDKLCLKVISSLHTAHSQTVRIPFGLNDGEFASLPSAELPVVYFIPPSAQRRLLFLPLLFHEFGHVLFACHEPEMRSLVRELQTNIREILEPHSLRDDHKAKADEQYRSSIVEVWYEWAQELFCDAVGLVIGGPAFAKAFSMFLRLGGREAFQVGSEELSNRVHPVTWIRIQVLADRAEKSGYTLLANELRETWRKLSAVNLIVEDYFGFYESNFLPFIQSSIDDMLIEASPQAGEFGVDIVSSREKELTTELESSFSALLNRAWRIFEQYPAEYFVWEKEIIERLTNRELSMQSAGNVPV